MDQPSKKPILSCKEEEEGEKAGAEELLEDCWYFGNLLHTKISMPRNCTPAPKSFEHTYKSIKKCISESGPSTFLMKTPSMPPILEAEGSDIGRGKSKAETETTPSDPLEEEIHDEETEFSMGKLIRQASMKNSDATIPTNHAAKPKGVSAARKEEFGNQKLERLRPRRAMSRLKPQKSLSYLQSQELRYLGLQELKIKEEDEGDEEGRKSSREDDMKAQIKFWARAVASNVRQEC